LPEKQKLGPFMIDLRLIAGVMFGVPPKLGSLENMLIMNIQERHRKRFPQTDVSRRGPRGTVWYLLNDIWYKSWTETIKIISNTKEDGEDLRDKTSDSSSPRRLGPINNTKLLRENGSLALRVDIKWRHDYEIIHLLDGLPYKPGTTGARLSVGWLYHTKVGRPILLYLIIEEGQCLYAQITKSSFIRSL